MTSNEMVRQLSVKRVRAVLAERDVNAFCEYAMRDGKGKPWVQAPFHREWQAMLPLEVPARVLIVAPRGHAKTTQMVIARTVWELGRNPDLRVKIVCATDDVAAERVAAIGDQIANNPHVREVFPELRPANRALWPKKGAQSDRLLVARSSREKDPSVSGHGVSSSGLGGRADLLIFDDVSDFRTSVAAPALRVQVIQAAVEVWVNMLGPGGRAVCVSTVWHDEDLTMRLRANPEWEVWWQPARDERTGEPLWPEQWTRESLDAREAEIGPRAFQRQFMLDPYVDEECTFPREMIASCRDPGLIRGDLHLPEHWPSYMGVDPASALGERASYSVIFIVTVDPDTEKRYPREIIRRRVNFPDLVNLIIASHQRFRPEAIVVENNSFQRALVDALRETECADAVKPFTTDQRKYDETIGLPAMAASMARGLWVIPSGGDPHDPACECGWCAWETELAHHPNCPTSDAVMAMWFIDQHLIREYPGRMEVVAISLRG